MPAPGALSLIRGQPNPRAAPRADADAELYLLVGDATAAPIASPERPGVSGSGCMCYPVALFVVKRSRLRVGFIGQGVATTPLPPRPSSTSTLRVPSGLPIPCRRLSTSFPPCVLCATC